MVGELIYIFSRHSAEYRPVIVFKRRIIAVKIDRNSGGKIRIAFIFKGISVVGAGKA